MAPTISRCPSSSVPTEETKGPQVRKSLCLQNAILYKIKGKYSIKFLPFKLIVATALLPSIDKGRHGFDGQKCPHTASSPLRIRQYSLRVFPCLGTFLLRQNCKAPASDEFTSDFWLLRRRRADARQGEKGKKRRKDTLAGVFALVNRWY